MKTVELAVYDTVVKLLSKTLVRFGVAGGGYVIAFRWGCRVEAKRAQSLMAFCTDDLHNQRAYIYYFVLFW